MILHLVAGESVIRREETREKRKGYIAQQATLLPPLSHQATHSVDVRGVIFSTWPRFGSHQERFCQEWPIPAS